LRESLRRLRVGSVYGLLEHDPERLLGARGGEVFAAMSALRDAGMTERIGVSVYSKDQLDAILDRYTIDLVQVPISVFDQRLLQGGTLRDVHAAGIEVHARSVLLQGLVGMMPDRLPGFLAGLSPPLRRLAELAEQNRLTPLAAAVAFVLDLTEVDVVLCGVEDQVQLREVLGASQVHLDTEQRDGFRELAVSDPGLIDPSRWPENR
jgi:aryl-alcohol dehydrogenase-like predicted oxidoreductase